MTNDIQYIFWEHLNHGNQLAEEGRHEEAIIQYSKHLSIEPDSGWAYYYRGKSLYDLKRYREAAEDFLIAHYHNKHNQEILLDWAIACLQSKDYSDWDSDKSSRIDSIVGAHYVHEMKGKYFASIGNYQRAITEYDQLLSSYNMYPDGFFYRGCSYHCLGNFPPALADYSKAIQLDPDFALAYSFRGLAKAVGRIDTRSAVDDCNLAIMKATAAAYYHIRSTVHRLAGNLELSNNDRQISIEIDPRQSFRTEIAEFVRLEDTGIR